MFGTMVDDITRQVLHDNTEAACRYTVTHNGQQTAIRLPTRYSVLSTWGEHRPAKPVLQLPASRQRPAQRDLVGVVQITADG
jgi:hypothetical protein